MADNEREVGADPIGRIVGARLRAAAKARGWSQGQVHYQANAGRAQGDEIVSLTTVQALLRGAYVNPSLASVLAVSRALGLTLDQVVGISPMPETVPAPPEDDASARLERLESVVTDLLERLAMRSEMLGEAAQAENEKMQRRPGDKPGHRRERKAE